MDKQSQPTERGKYLLLEMWKRVAEGVRMQCGWERFLEDEQNSRAAKLYTMNLKGGKNIPTENLVTKRYISKFGYFVSFSASYTFFARVIRWIFEENWQDYQGFAINVGDVDWQTKTKVERKKII